MHPKLQHQEDYYYQGQQDFYQERWQGYEDPSYDYYGYEQSYYQPA